MATISLPTRVGLWQRLRALSLTDTLLGASGSVVLLSWVVLALVHLADSYGLNHVSSVYSALAVSFHDGRYYPPLADDGHYGGCRYMPLQPFLHATLARVTNDYLISGKLLAWLLTVTLLLELILILRDLGCRPGLSLALASLVLLTRAGYLAATTIRGDLLPVVLQLGALLVVRHWSGWRGLLVAAGLCCLALMAKQTAAWGGAAIILSCWPGRWRLGVLFAVIWLGLFALSMVALHLATHGLMLANFAVGSAGGLSIVGVAMAPLNLLYRLGRGDVTAVFLVPLAVVGCVVAWRSRQMTVYHRALLLSLPILVVIFADKGSDYNHLLDLVVLAVPVAGCLWGTLPQGAENFSGARAGLAVVGVWVLFAGWAGVMERPLREIVFHRADLALRYPARPLVGVLPEDGSIFSEDPWVEVSRGRRPVVQDMFALAVMTQKYPDVTAPLIRQLEQGAFQRVVLLRQLDRPNGDDWYEWYGRNLGPVVVRAIANHYELVEQKDGYFVYAPKGHLPLAREEERR
jgi:hypothetical protein